MMGSSLGIARSCLGETYRESNLGFILFLEYNLEVNGTDKPVIWLRGEIKTPPFTDGSRREIGALLRVVQDGETLGMPFSRPMPSIGPRCHELRVADAEHNWRLIYRIDPDAILVVDVFAKTTRKTTKQTIDACKARLRVYDRP
jgi:phage-related protein